MENFLLEIRKFILSKILRRKYYRTGKCKACGKCCTKIYVKHFRHVIQDEEEFKKLQYLHRFYTYLKVIDKDETGLVFECQNLDPKTHKCKIHKSRPGICRRYPQEELFSMGGALSEDCGYKMLPIESFDKVMKKLSKKKFLLILVMFLLLNSPVYSYNGFSDEFTDKFKACSMYGEENVINNKGVVFKDMKFFARENSNSCVYFQTIFSSYGTISIKCNFNNSQIDLLHNTMKNNNPKNGYDNTAEKLWNTYINDPNICTIKKDTMWDVKPLVPEIYLPETINK
jgi:Fe-S-cluster containining protein